ncbi:MAG: hypothetical protein LBG83_04985 [Oscillospiraceae bacterium]|jgi:hypothetical protein|nr:hypothetical protein [Oscillospiraceae bacterium]
MGNKMRKITLMAESADMIAKVYPVYEGAWVVGFWGSYEFSALVRDYNGGIDDGRVANLLVLTCGCDKESASTVPLWSFDGEWVNPPRNEAEETSLNVLLEQLNTLPKGDYSQLLAKAKQTSENKMLLYIP